MRLRDERLALYAFDGPISASNVVGTSLTCALPSTHSTTLCSTAMRLEVGQALGLLVVPAHHGVGLLVGLRDLLHHRLHLLGLRAAGLALRTSSPTMSPSATRSSACGRNMSGDELDVLRLHALLLRGWRPCAASSCARFHVDQRLRQRRTASSRAAPSSPGPCSTGFDLALELELQVRLDLGAQVLDACPTCMPNAVANALSSGGTSGSLDARSRSA